jgi:hypothetical protein
MSLESPALKQKLLLEFGWCCCHLQSWWLNMTSQYSIKSAQPENDGNCNPNSPVCLPCLHQSYQVTDTQTASNSGQFLSITSSLYTPDLDSLQFLQMSRRWFSWFSRNSAIHQNFVTEQLVFKPTSIPTSTMSISSPTNLWAQHLLLLATNFVLCHSLDWWNSPNQSEKNPLVAQGSEMDSGMPKTVAASARKDKQAERIKRFLVLAQEQGRHRTTVWRLKCSTCFTGHCKSWSICYKGSQRCRFINYHKAVAFIQNTNSI